MLKECQKKVENIQQQKKEEQVMLKQLQTELRQAAMQSEKEKENCNLQKEREQATLALQNYAEHLQQQSELEKLKLKELQNKARSIEEQKEKKQTIVNSLHEEAETFQQKVNSEKLKLSQIQNDAENLRRQMQRDQAILKRLHKDIGNIQQQLKMEKTKLEHLLPATANSGNVLESVEQCNLEQEGQLRDEENLFEADNDWKDLQLESTGETHQQTKDKMNLTQSAVECSETRNTQPEMLKLKKIVFKIFNGKNWETTEEHKFDPSHIAHVVKKYMMKNYFPCDQMEQAIEPSEWLQVAIQDGKNEVLFTKNPDNLTHVVNEEITPMQMIREQPEENNLPAKKIRVSIDDDKL
ncbi:hypothetical protein PRK78_006572 [Emydomyces testavorans]|uniref:Uncharacterized protein n=1 Tax=Emydomyces testavorans TaxID=2070801 RepID=A0AAF0DMC6_9EURO|nr:hypothetical protein PRK78_006572 [Emydomyces testavorans]